MNGDTFRCAECGDEYQKAWSDEEAAAEKVALFPDVPDSACVVICDDCFNKIMPSNA